MAMVALAATAIGGIVSAMGAMEQGQASANMQNYQAQVAQQNQQIALQQAGYEQRKGELQAQEQGIKTKANVGAILAQQGASGLDPTQGSASAVRASAEKLGGFNEQLVRADASRRAYDYQVGAFTDAAQARLYQFGAQQAPIGAMYTAAGDVFGAGGSVAGKWYQYQGGGGGAGLGA